MRKFLILATCHIYAAAERLHVGISVKGHCLQRSLNEIEGFSVETYAYFAKNK